MVGDQQSFFRRQLGHLAFDPTVQVLELSNIGFGIRIIDILAGWIGLG